MVLTASTDSPGRIQQQDCVPSLTVLGKFVNNSLYLAQFGKDEMGNNAARMLFVELVEIKADREDRHPVHRG